MKEQRFFADGYVSRNRYPSALVLENHLREINNPIATKWVKKLLHDFSIAIKDVRDSDIRNKEFLGRLVIKHFIAVINKAENKPEKVRSLLRNIMVTKFKLEVLKIDKNPNCYGALGMLSKQDARLEKLIDEIKEEGETALTSKNGYLYGELGQLVLPQDKINEVVESIKSQTTLEGIYTLHQYMKPTK